MIRSITPAELLNVWEVGADEPPYARALRFLVSALPDHTPEALAAWSLGHRDHALLTLRERLFGDHLNAVANCPLCETRLELDFRTTDIRMPYADTSASVDTLATVKSTVGQQRYSVRLRALSTHDLIDAARNPTHQSVALIRRCIVEARRDSAVISAEEVPSELVVACADALAACDPQADVRIALTCPDCAHQWDARFDINTYMWHEVEMWARRTLREVLLLASACGWSEGEILTLSNTRRRMYLELVAR